jgi:hypothetical protein
MGLLSAAERRELINAKKKEGFDRWLDEPTVRLGMSLIPPSESADALRIVLQSAFEAGFVCGSSAVMLDIAVECLDQDRERRRRE